MTEQNEQTQELKTISISENIRKLSFEGLTTREIKQKLQEGGLNKSSKYIASILSRTKKRQLEQPQEVKEEFLRIEITENEQGHLILFVKTDYKYEEYLKARKELRETDNLFGLGRKGVFYYSRLDNDYTIDDINSLPFRNLNFNRGILRIKGISEGLSFDLTEMGFLLTELQIKTAIKKFLAIHNEFYVRNVLNQKLAISGVLQK